MRSSHDDEAGNLRHGPDGRRMAAWRRRNRVRDASIRCPMRCGLGGIRWASAVQRVIHVASNAGNRDGVRLRMQEV
jgi:hypothetical protein